MADFVLDFTGPGARSALAAVDSVQALVSAAQVAESGAEAAEAGAVTARNTATAEADRAALAVSSIEGIDNFYPNQAAGEAAVTNGVFTTVDGGNNLIYIKRVAGVSTQISPGAFATLTGAQTLSNKTLAGDVDVVTNGGVLAVTNAGTAVDGSNSVTHIFNNGDVSTGLRVVSQWEGSTATPFINNDCVLFVVYNKTLSDSANLSWAASCSNNYNDIPLGVTDSGERVGVIGWAGSVATTGHQHAGILASQVGVKGTAGFQGTGSAATAVVQKSVGVQGRIVTESAGATIEVARAGEFDSPGGDLGTVQTNIAVYARAIGGTVSNYSFYGEDGEFYNFDGLTTEGSVDGAGFKIAGVDIFDGDSGNHRFLRPDGQAGVTLGSGSILYTHTSHVFASTAAAVTFATIDATGVDTTGAYKVDGAQVVGNRGAAVTALTITATTGSLPTANGSVTFANAATPTVSELLEAFIELNTKFETLKSRISDHGLITA